MLTTRRRPTAFASLSPLLVGICLACALLFHLPKSTAGNEVTAPDRKASEAQQALDQGDVYFDKSQYLDAGNSYQNAITLAAKKGDAVAESRGRSRLALVSIYLGQSDVARRQLTKAFSLLPQPAATPDEKTAYGEALTVEGELLHGKGKFKEALLRLDEALKSLDGDRNGQARVHLFIGYIQGSIGNNYKALVEIEQAQKLYQAVNNTAGEAQASRGLGLSYAARHDYNSAIPLYNSALEIFRSVGDRHSEAIANNSLAEAYEQLKDPQRALIHYQEALRLFESINAVNGIAPTTCLVAHGHFLNGHLDEALTFYQRCLDLSHKAGMGRTEAGALNEIAGVYASQQRYKLAFAQQRKAQKFYKKTGDQRGLARALNVEGDISIQAGQNKRAFGAYQRALTLSQESEEQDTQLAALYGLAKTKLALGDPDAALSFIQNSIKLIEDLRSNVASPEFRTSYFSGERQHYDLWIGILMQLEQLRSGKGFKEQALIVAEQSRARMLLDLVNESRARIRAGATKELLDREGELRGLYREQVQYRMDLKDPVELAEVDTQLAELKAKHQEVEGQLRQQSPYLSSLEKFEPLSLDQIQKQLEPDTLLLEYALGDEKSYLFAVTSDSFQIHELPKRQLIEDPVRKYYEQMTVRQDPSVDDYQTKIKTAEATLNETGSALSQMLLGPVADKLGNKRLVLVLEGALQYVPFAALPSPESATSLNATHEIVVEPSFSTLDAIRKRKTQNPTSPDKLVAVIADPVMPRGDDRVQRNPIPPGTTVAATRDESLVRLAHASEEADAIAAAAPWGTTLIAKGFDANRETAMSANVGQFQIVHFATHGLLDSEHPEVSSLVLTMVDRHGEKVDGLMSLTDIYSLDLSAQLTVLSACQTALGKDIRGEGLVGLNHAFISAGSKSVVSSLWKVDDRATAVLMSEFYDAMFNQGLSPAAALRAAQLKMPEKGFGAPYYWAGFVIQGEYTNHITVQRRSPFRVALVLVVVLSLVTAGVLVLRKHRISSTPSNEAEHNA